MRRCIAFIMAANLWLGATVSLAAQVAPPGADAFGRVPAIDSVAPIAPSQAMIKAQRGRAPQELIELPGEDHWLSSSATRIRVLAERERFLAKHLRWLAKPATER